MSRTYLAFVFLLLGTSAVAEDYEALFDVPVVDDALAHDWSVGLAEVSGVERVAVLDRNISPGHGGIFAEEIRSALYDVPAEDRPTLFGYVVGLGGRDVTPPVIESIIDRTRRSARPEREDLWVGVEL